MTLRNTVTYKPERWEWLEKSNVQYEKKMVMADLLYLVKQHKPLPIYIIDEFAPANGHEI